MDLIAERESILARQQKKWAKICMLSVPLHLQLHPYSPPSLGRLMVFLAI